MKKGIIAAIVVIAIVIIGAAVYWTSTSHKPQPSQPTSPARPQHGEQPAQGRTGQGQPTEGQSTQEQPAQGEQNQPGNGQTDHRPSPSASEKSSGANAAPAGSPAERYCADDHDKSDTSALTQAGGLVQIFQHEAAVSDAYDCASVYLDHGGDVDAIDPRSDAGHLTPLLFAVKRNDPKMVRFLLDHGADPSKRGGPKKIKPYGYAVFQALHNRSTNYNPVINILDSALGDNPAASDGS